MHVFKSNVLGLVSNTRYPHEFIIDDKTGKEELKDIFNKDYVCARYKDNKRSGDNYIVSDCLALDCDNDHSDNPDSWITPEDVIRTFEGVFMVFHMSRNHMKEKDGKAARPKFHVFMAMDEIKEESKYAELKRRVNYHFPYFDKNAEDSARFFFGTEQPEVMISRGNETINHFLDSYDAFANMDDHNQIIPCGQRNSMLSKYAAAILKRYGDTDEARELFDEKNDKCCEEPLEDEELNSIWRSALSFYKNKILTNPNYVPPDKYDDGESYVPTDMSDIGQAKEVVKHYGNIISYNTAMKFLVYRDNRWIESEELALEIIHRFTDKQILQAMKLYREAVKTGDKTKIDNAKGYLKFATSRRNSNYITATLKQMTPYIDRDTDCFDRDPFLLSTPDGVYDLRKGPINPKPHDPEDYMTKMTTCSPSFNGRKLWEDTLDKIFSGDKELIKYVQQCCGLAAIGGVYVEMMIIAHGDGGNGKSTFWNTILKVFGDYGGTLSSDNLFINSGKSSRFAKAFLKGKRLIVSSESELGARLNDGMVKQLCSTDRIKGEKKFKDEFDFVPSHTLVLYTNHLPKVSAGDDGLWRRVVIIPFNNKFTGKNDTKNFSDVLFEQCREYILYWVMEGAKIVYDNKFHIDEPKVVSEAKKQYKNDNDWLQQFISECCKREPTAKVGAGELYEKYRTYAWKRNEYARPSTDFKKAMEAAGFISTHPHNKTFYHGIRLLTNAENDFAVSEDDFLN